MKSIIALLLLAAITLTSCTGNSEYQVQYADGEIRWVNNHIQAEFNSGDTIVTALYTITGNTYVYGTWTGTMPAIYEDVDIFYQKAVVLK